MAVGFPIGKAEIDGTLGQISVQLRDSISRVPVLVGNVGALADADLQGLGYSSADITLLRAACADLQLIHDIAFGVSALPAVYDFRQNISKVTGLA